MGKTKGRVEQERRLVDMAITPPAEVRWEPNLDAIVEEYPINMPLGELRRIVGRQAFDESNRLVEFALTAQIKLHSGTWSDVVRFDTAHGEVHVHYFSRTGDQIDREVLYPILSVNDVDKGYEDAETLIIVRWDENEERWRHGC